MQTYSHFFMTAALREAMVRGDGAEPHASLLLGAILPDLPLGALSAGFLAWARVTGRSDQMTLCGERYNQLYFHHPLWITGHNLFHAPLLLLGYAGVGLAARRRTVSGAEAWLWLVAGCALHSAVDFVTHVDDGPLPLFPFEQRRRIRGLVSYWDPDFGGTWFKRLEKVIAVILALLAGVMWWRRQAGP